MAARSTRSSLVLFIQALYWLSLIALLLFSWIRSRGVLHPHILFCGMLFVLASDFMIRGNDDANLQGIAANNLATYQIRTLVTLILIGVSTMFVRRPYELDRSMLQPEMRVSKGFGYGMLGAGAAIIIVQQVFRLLSVDWSIDELVQQMLGPRDYRLWDLPDSSGNRSAVLQLVSGLLPLAAMCFAFLLFQRALVLQIVAALLLALSLAVLVTDGSRTMAMIPFIAFGVFGLIRLRSTAARAVFGASLAAAMALLTSAMILFRSTGIQNSQSELAFTYHQDDSIYRIWSACAFADFSNYRWNPLYFFYYVISLPIPRSFWEGKPILDDNFYGGFKIYFVTTSFIGEWVSMFGSTVGFVASFLFANLLYRAFYSSQRLLKYPLGLPAYLLCTIYVYTIIRSMPNLTIFIFAPAASLMLVYLARRRTATPLRVAAATGASAW
jgi:hypothetical protein